MTNRNAIIALLIIITALATNLFLDANREPEQTEETASNDPDMYMLNATISEYDEQGVLQHKINASRFTHFPLTNMTVLKAPAMNLFASDNGASNPPWDITANNGRLLSRSDYRHEVVELWDNVVASQVLGQGSFKQIDAISLTIYPARDYAETNQQVTISDQMGATVAAGMQAFFGEGKYLFYSSANRRVSTTLAPNTAQSITTP